MEWLDCVLDGTKEAVLKELEKRSAAGVTPEPVLIKKSGQLFYNTSPLDMKKLMGDQDHIKENLFAYVQGFSPSVKDIFECFDFYTQVDRLFKASLLYLVSEKFANVDLHPAVVSNTQMGTVFEELIRKFAELSNETAGEHMSPREVIRLMMNLLFVEDMLSNPPFGVEWKKIESFIRKEYEQQSFNGRFGPGLPRVSDGSLLFLMHLFSKMRPAKDGGSRFGIVLNGSPLFTGGAGSGESEIRRYVLENDLLEAIIGLPTDMFYNTGISTYVWIVSNRKPAHRKGKLQLIDASGMWQKMRKSLGSKRKELSEDHIAEITRLFGECKESNRHSPNAVASSPKADGTRSDAC